MKKNYKEQEWVSVIISSIFCLSTLLVVVVILMALWYSFFNADDYAHALNVMNNAESFIERLKYGVYKSIDFYKTFGGTYSGVFLEIMGEPMNYGGYAALHISLMFNFIVLVAAILLFMFVFLFDGGLNYTESAIVSGSVIWAFFNYNAWPQVLFWYTGSIMYAIPFACLLFGLSFWNISHKNNSIIMCVIACLFVIIAMGGVQCIPVVGCFLFAIGLFFYIKKHDLKNIDICFVVFGTVCGLINVLSPGNFNRRQLGLELNQNITLVRAFFYAVRRFVIESEKMIKDTGFVVLLLIVFLIGIKTYTRYRSIDWIKVLILLFSAILIIFPICYGYGSPYLPDRSIFLEMFFLICGYTYFSLQCGRFVSHRLQFESENKRIEMVAFFVVLCAIVVSVCIPWRMEQGEIYKLNKAYMDGSLSEYYAYVISIDKQIESEEIDANVIVKYREPIDGFIGTMLQEDPTAYANEAMAAYYSVNSVMIK